MAKITLPPDAFKEFVEGETLVSPGWHPIEITKHEAKMSSKGDSMNYWFYYRILEDQFSKRTGLRFLLNEKSFEPSKAKYEVIPFISALDSSVDPKELMKTGITFDPETAVGRKLKVRIKHEESSNGRLYETVSGFTRIDDNV